MNAAIADVCCLLDASPWELGIMSSSKGLIAGPLTIKLADNSVIDCVSLTEGNKIDHFTHTKYRSLVAAYLALDDT